LLWLAGNGYKQSVVSKEAKLASRTSSPIGLESSLTESKGQPQASRDLIDVVNVLSQHGSVVAAARVVALNDLNAKAIKGLIVQALKVFFC